ELSFAVMADQTLTHAVGASGVDNGRLLAPSISSISRELSTGVKFSFYYRAINIVKYDYNPLSTGIILTRHASST
ncbi:MAG TPA: hypothetical protein VG324_05260, partial [Blastocatellia bacterium]|nr:hypothetical protein [Blastocatellia bacterium]